MEEEARALERELRQAQEKLAEERNSAVHLRIAAVEAQARADRDAQALVNQRQAERIESVKGAVDELKADTTKGFSDTAVGMKDLRNGILGLGVLMLLVLAANAPGLLALIKGRLP